MSYRGEVKAALERAWPFVPAPLPEPTPLPVWWRPPAGWARWYASVDPWRASFYNVLP